MKEFAPKQRLQSTGSTVGPRANTSVHLPHSPGNQRHFTPTCLPHQEDVTSPWILSHCYSGFLKNYYFTVPYDKYRKLKYSFFPYIHSVQMGIFILHAILLSRLLEVPIKAINITFFKAALLDIQFLI